MMQLNTSQLADIVGCLGFLISTISIFSSILKNRIRFSISVIDYAHRYRSTQFLISITNLSYQPLTITDIKFCQTSCELEPKKIRGDPDSWNGATTPRFPLCIPARSAQFAYIEFVGCQHNPLVAGMSVNFQIQTIQHRVSKNVPLDNTAGYLHIRH